VECRPDAAAQGKPKNRRLREAREAQQLGVRTMRAAEGKDARIQTMPHAAMQGMAWRLHGEGCCQAVPIPYVLVQYKQWYLRIYVTRLDLSRTHAVRW
jgi:hypothetical protein